MAKHSDRIHANFVDIIELSITAEDVRMETSWPPEPAPQENCAINCTIKLDEHEVLCDMT